MRNIIIKFFFKTFFIFGSRYKYTPILCNQAINKFHKASVTFIKMSHVSGLIVLHCNSVTVSIFNSRKFISIKCIYYFFLSRTIINNCIDKAACIAHGIAFSKGITKGIKSFSGPPLIPYPVSIPINCLNKKTVSIILFYSPVNLHNNITAAGTSAFFYKSFSLSFPDSACF